MYDTVLVPTDGSEHAERAATHAQYLATAFDATVHVVTVVDLQAAGGPFDAGGVDDAFVDRLEAEGERAIEAIESTFEGSALETAVVRGQPDEAILDYADEYGVDVIAMGTHGRTGFGRYLAGSVTEAVVRHAEVPVLTVRQTAASQEADYDEVMIPTDGSAAAGAAVEHGLAVADRTGARVHAVNVVNVNDLATGADYTLPTELLDSFEKQGQRITDEIASAARDRGLDAVTEVREGFPGRDLLDYAETAEIDLIAMGTAGRTGLRRFLLGSTAERVIRHADAPVLAVTPGDEE